MRPFRADIVVLAACLALAPFAAAAQEAATDAEEAQGSNITQEIVEIEHADLEALVPVLRVFNVSVQGQRELGLITIKGAPEDVALAAAAARRLDVPPKRNPGVEVIVHVLGASKDSDLPGGVPEALEEVAQQLRGVFGYRSVRLLDSLALRARDRAAGQVMGSISLGPGLQPIPYQFGFNRVSIIDGGDEREVRLDGLRFEAQVPLAQGVAEPPQDSRVRSDLVRLITDVDVREGQKAVVGKAASSGTGREGLIVVIEARVLD